jgi:hypothetical protein
MVQGEVLEDRPPLPETSSQSPAESGQKTAAPLNAGRRKGKKRISGAERKKRKSRSGDDAVALLDALPPVLAAMLKAPRGKKGQARGGKGESRRVEEKGRMLRNLGSCQGPW